MHKKRLRKKIGKQHRDRMLSKHRALAAAGAAMCIMQGQSRVMSIVATSGVPAVMKTVAQVEAVTQAQLAAAKAFEPVDAVKKPSPEKCYRMRYGYR